MSYLTAGVRVQGQSRVICAQLALLAKPAVTCTGSGSNDNTERTVAGIILAHGRHSARPLCCRRLRNTPAHNYSRINVTCQETAGSTSTISHQLEVSGAYENLLWLPLMFC